jgi:hypothetical protein
MKSLSSFLAFVLCLALASPAWAQFKDDDPGGIQLGKAKTQRWRVGMTITAASGACSGIVMYLACPSEWPEQDVKIVEQKISPEVKVTYDIVERTVKVMVLKIPQLANGKTVEALITVEVRRSEILPPEQTDQFAIPDKKKLGKELSIYLQPSPKIESRDSKITALAKEIGADKETTWQRVEAIYDWVRDKLKYKKDAPNKGALSALKSESADCEDMTCLFIAICRAANIPARTVWVPEHCYPEFYLTDKEGKGHWFPCQIAGSRSFGGIPETRPILQKGDNFPAPWDRKTQLRYMAEHIDGSTRGGNPLVRFIRESVEMPKDD